MPSRRAVLGSLAGTSVGGLAGCGGLLDSGTPQGDGETIEVIVTNETAETALLGVRVETETGETLFSRVYRLESSKTDQSAGVDTVPGRIRAFTPDGTAAVRAYDPESDLDCAGQDVGITIAADGHIESWPPVRGERAVATIVCVTSSRLRNHPRGSPRLTDGAGAQ